MLRVMTSAEFKRWLQKRGCSFSAQAKDGHLTVLLGDRKTVLPMHGKDKEPGTGLVAAIKCDLGLK